VTLESVNTVTPTTDPADRDVQRLRETSGKIVGSVFFGTLLKSMRESRLAGPYGHGGRGEEVFAAQLHGLLAERMGTRIEKDLHDALFRQLEKQQRLIGMQRPTRAKEVTEHESS
jgi:hypothetical protein